MAYVELDRAYYEHPRRWHSLTTPSRNCAHYLPFFSPLVACRSLVHSITLVLIMYGRFSTIPYMDSLTYFSFLAMQLAVYVLNTFDKLRTLTLILFPIMFQLLGSELLRCNTPWWCCEFPTTPLFLLWLWQCDRRLSRCVFKRLLWHWRTTIY